MKVLLNAAELEKIHSIKMPGVFLSSGISIGNFYIEPYVITAFAVTLILAVLCFFLSRGLKLYKISRRQAIAEIIVSSCLNMVSSAMGGEEKAKKYLPVVGSFFICIIFSNYLGVIPGNGIFRGFLSPTSVLTGTVSLAICSFGLTMYFGIRAHGLKYFKHYVEPYVPFLPINLIEEFSKPLSLSLRLFGSIVAEEGLLVAIYGVFPYGLPVLFIFISLFFGALQAYIFTMLTATYIDQATVK